MAIGHRLPAKLASVAIVVTVLTALSGCSQSQDVRPGDSITLTSGASLVVPVSFTGYVVADSLGLRAPAQRASAVVLSSGGGDDVLRIELMDAAFHARFVPVLERKARTSPSEYSLDSTTLVGASASTVFASTTTTDSMLTVLVPQAQGEWLWLTISTPESRRSIGGGVSPVATAKAALASTMLDVIP